VTITTEDFSIYPNIAAEHDASARPHSTTS
jgi:hypothetical protein